MGLPEYKIIDIDSNLFLGPNPYKREVHIVIISLQPHNFRVHQFYDYRLLSTNNGGSEIACDLTICQQSSRRTHDVLHSMLHLRNITSRIAWASLTQT